MSLFDAMFRTFGAGTLMWSHGDAEAVDIIPPTGAEITSVEAIHGDERWETVASDRGERRRKACWWSVRAESWTSPAVRSRIRRRSTGELWEVREILSRDAVMIRVDCVLVAAVEQTTVRKGG